MTVEKGNISVDIALSGDEEIKTKEKKKESIAERTEREKGEVKEIKGKERDAFIGLGKMFSEEEETENPFETSFGKAFSQTRKTLRQK